MRIDQCWIAHSTYDATGEGMHYAVSIATSAERAEQHFEECVTDLLRGSSTTAPLAETLEKYPGLGAVIPKEVLLRTGDALCWKLEYFGAVDFYCA